jgi:hypothetical protein
MRGFCISLKVPTRKSFSDVNGTVSTRCGISPRVGSRLATVASGRNNGHRKTLRAEGFRVAGTRRRRSRHVTPEAARHAFAPVRPFGHEPPAPEMAFLHGAVSRVAPSSERPNQLTGRGTSGHGYRARGEAVGSGPTRLSRSSRIRAGRTRRCGPRRGRYAPGWPRGVPQPNRPGQWAPNTAEIRTPVLHVFPAGCRVGQIY